jgi:hypothetical protein
VNFKSLDKEHPGFLANLDVLEIRDTEWRSIYGQVLGKNHHSTYPDSGPLKYCKNFRELRIIRKKYGGKWQDNQSQVRDCLRLSINTSFIVVGRILAALFQKLSCSVTRSVNKRWLKLGGDLKSGRKSFDGGITN